MAITEFKGEYRFLSNFVLAPVSLAGRLYPTVEHAYQAAKTIIPTEREVFRKLTLRPGAAKRLGRRVTLRPDWEQIKLEIMLDLLTQKFDQPNFKELLLKTGDEELIEGNHWGDTYWGQCPIGVGENHLGKLLMQIRRELRGQAQVRL